MRWRTSATTAIAVLVVGIAPATATGRGEAESSSRDAVAGAVEYVTSQQVDDGGFFVADQAAATSGGLSDTLVALGTARVDRDSRAAALERLGALTTEPPDRAAYAGRIVQAVVASGLDPRSFGGRDHVADLDAFYGAGFWETQMYANALAALGHVASGRDLPLEAVLWFRANQCRDGGFAWMTGCTGGGDVDTTALVLNALLSGGLPVGDLAVQRARAYLVSARNGSGGFGDRPATETNANSTGLALSAIAALGESPADAPWSSGGGVDPLTQLLSLQTSSGGFLWKASRPSIIDNYATVQAIPGAAGKSYPIFGSAESLCDRPGRRVGLCRP